MLNATFRVSYRDDIKLFQTKLVKFWILAFFVFLILFPLIFDRYFIYLANLSGIAIIGTLGLNILVGNTGLISLGHAAFVAIGAYTSALCITRLNVPFVASIPVAGVTAALAGLIVAIPSLRLRGLYIAVTTFAFGFIVEHVIVRWDAVTGGPDGIALPPASIAGLGLDTDRRFFYFLLVMVVVLTAFARNLFRTRIGRAFVAIRDHDISAQVMGIDLARYKILSFSVSSFYAGVAGALLAGYTKFITFEHFTLHLSIEYLAMIIVGGMGSILGSIYGAVFMTFLPEGIRLATDLVRDTYPLLTTRFAALTTVVNGLIIVLFLVFEPEGFYGRWKTIKAYWYNWPFTY
ncbi:MAG: branched-chain amino acid ABC transporter permease [Deltaproteobacteria bacterium]|nr:branched-chain amino acid ABC transporter permease [Deltaproteobacteria bacterium]MBW1921880.1 branched-chain amino acid ABC transporter permease [Deltaproteobacteria bacterium]MBW1948043.1 branched-chain amino acid ABC transporter permease [Deltaproteobacteria bacterium]MBW2006922.1 branched-chain amino acid ABC transporter permease [Deltaproteobacteria bacterium]MBW2347387.1 branched-chain amino acid ABC transporter permease [Deltaproteobacteria bacterium]